MNRKKIGGILHTLDDFLLALQIDLLLLIAQLPHEDQSPALREPLEPGLLVEEARGMQPVGVLPLDLDEDLLLRGLGVAAAQAHVHDALDAERGPVVQVQGPELLDRTAGPHAPREGRRGADPRRAVVRVCAVRAEPRLGLVQREVEQMMAGWYYFNLNLVEIVD